MKHEHVVHTESESHDLAAWLYRSVPGPARIALIGELGSGKTSFARGFLHSAGWTGRVPSPTFTIVNEYLTDPPVYHADLYRLADEQEFDELALPELDDGIVLIEWADRFRAVLDSCTVTVSLSRVAGTPAEERRIRIDIAETPV